MSFNCQDKTGEYRVIVSVLITANHAQEGRNGHAVWGATNLPNEQAESELIPMNESEKLTSNGGTTITKIAHKTCTNATYSIV